MRRGSLTAEGTRSVPYATSSRSRMDRRVTRCIGILAYGSLIEDPGKELRPLIRRTLRDILTPFSVEFARSSSSRDGAPTLVPVETGGAPVSAAILILDGSVNRRQAEDLLWRRETRNELSRKHYGPPASPGRNHVIVDCVEGLAGVETVLFTRIGANIQEPTPEHLADLAIRSARLDAGARAEDGISYLASVARQGIETPLLSRYRDTILRKTATSDLEEARAKIRCGHR